MTNKHCQAEPAWLQDPPKCTCQDKSLCRRISKKHDKEVGAIPC